MHPIGAIELCFGLPDDLATIPPKKREGRTYVGADACAIWGNDDASHRYFMRGLLPLQVQEWSAPYSLGVWLEVSQDAYQRICALWTAPDQANEPPFSATLANAVPFHESTTGLPGILSLTGPTTRPKFQLSPSANSLYLEQKDGVSAHRAVEYANLSRKSILSFPF